MARTLAVMLALTVFCAFPRLSAGQGRDHVLPAPSPRPVLVELFTSEGCSSCPPADDLLRQINGTSTTAGQLLIGISEHVTYWNSLGWTDPFSADTFTARQNAYGERFHLDDIYTPQMIVNGREQIVGGNGPALRTAVQDQLKQPSIPLQILFLQRDGGKLNVGFRVGDLSSGPSLDLMAAVTDDLDTSSIPRGENAGRMLQHVAVARSLTHLATITSPGEQTVQLPFTPVPDMHRKSEQTLILFLQAPHLGPVVGTTLRAIP